MSDDEATVDVRPSYGPRLAWGLVRLATAALLIVALGAQLVTSVSVALDRGQHVPTVIANFFSFFTVLSNILAAIVLLVGAFWLLVRGARRETEPAWLTTAFISVGTYMVVTGIVFNVLLRGIPLPEDVTVWWSSEIMHVLGPIVLLVDLILRVARRTTPWRTVGIATVIPIVWVIYTLARGEHITSPVTGQPWWYPYPFLNPYLVVNGYLGVGAYVLGIAAAIVLIASAAVWWTRRHTPRAVLAPAADPLTTTELPA